MFDIQAPSWQPAKPTLAAGQTHFGDPLWRPAKPTLATLFGCQPNLLWRPALATNLGGLAKVTLALFSSMVFAFCPLAKPTLAAGQTYFGDLLWPLAKPTLATYFGYPFGLPAKPTLATHLACKPNLLWLPIWATYFGIWMSNN